MTQRLRDVLRNSKMMSADTGTRLRHTALTAEVQHFERQPLA